MSDPESEKLYWGHPEGHGSTIPCTHPCQLHPEGDPVMVPCTHPPVQAHPNGDRVPAPPPAYWKTVPCIHRVPPHPNGDQKMVPCVHWTTQHPGGDPGPTLPCTHPLVPAGSSENGLLVFFTANAAIQAEMARAIPRFRALGVDLITPVRPLHIFHRPGLTTNDNSDPFWSHYSPVFHCIQVIDTGQADIEKVQTLRHELGHALVGNHVVNHYAGGPHDLKVPAASYALAMSEGWANFVGLVLTAPDNRAADTSYKGENWETMNIAPNGKIEYCVASCLWDLFDTSAVRQTLSGLKKYTDDEAVCIPFAELFKIYSPALQTVPNGPWISSIWDFLDRLKANLPNSDLHARIDAAMLKNVGSRPSDA